MIEGLVRFVHVLAEFSCDKCGGPALRMSRAPLDASGTIRFAERPPSVTCNDCERGQREADEKARKEQMARRAWARNQQDALRGLKGKHRD